ncbi:MAG: hypothetical protein QM537_04610 [Candidatus Symbiobacter sp.]|nr:hypothetical protein [Candidatus Symbiobacter sp.]
MTHPSYAVTVPEALSQFVAQRVQQDDYPSASAYVAHLIDADQREKQYQEWLEHELELGLASGISDRTLDEIFDEVEKKFVHGQL